MNTILWILGLLFALIVIIVALAMLVASIEVRKEQKEYFKGKNIDRRHWLILLPLLLMFSCHPTNFHFTRLQESGTYTVDTRSGNQTTFKEVSGRYDIRSDTLKPGDKIEITVISNHRR